MKEKIMTETILIAIFAASLLGAIAAGLSVLVPLALGFFIFFGYGLFRGFSPAVMLREALKGVSTVKTILTIFIFIGMLTAVWRAGGTIAFIVYHAAGVCTPALMLPACFILCAMLSVLTGTSFGTSATMGVICMTMADSMGLPQVLSGGAILAGAFYGDRCSPMSTSALLVSELTGSGIYTNIKNMIKTAVVPTLLTIAFYTAAGMFWGGSGLHENVGEVLETGFSLSVLTLIPALLVIVLSLAKVKVRMVMACSIAAGALVCIFVQHMSLYDLALTLVKGFSPQDPDLAALMSGGGILSMVRVAAIVCISSSYAGMFEATGFLKNFKSMILGLCRRTGNFAGTMMVSMITCMVTCNQSLSIILVNQLTGDVEPVKEKKALYLEDTVVVMAALIPWSIAGAVPLDTVGAPLTAMAAAFYLYAQPLWSLLVFRRKKVILKNKS